MQANYFHIRDYDSIQAVQDHFSRLFPSMQISFFRDPDELRGTDQCIMFSPTVKISGIHPLEKELVIEITPKMRVIDFENIIHSLGYHVQISCRISKRPLSDVSVSNWLLKDVYGVDAPPSKWDSILK
jgi:hypothetical protein